jgi:hypothetical protein
MIINNEEAALQQSKIILYSVKQEVFIKIHKEIHININDILK